MERECELPFGDEPIRGRVLCRADPAVGDARLLRCLHRCRVVRIAERIEVRLVDVLRVGGRCRRLHLVRIVEQHAEVAHASDAAVAAHGRQAVLQTREAEHALLRLVRLPVVVDLLVRARGDAVTPAAAAVLRDQHHAVLVALVDRARGARRDAGGVEAVVAETRQMLHEDVVELKRDLLSDLAEVVVLACGLSVGEVILPVRAPFDLHALLRDERARTRHGLVVAPLRVDQRLIVVRPRLIVVVHLGLLRMVKELREARDLAAGLEAQLAVLQLPAALPFFLILPLLRVADAGFCLDVVEIHILRAASVRPDVLAQDGARMTANALVEIHDHRDLCFNLQANLPPPCAARRHTSRAGCPSGRSS